MKRKVLLVALIAGASCLIYAAGKQIQKNKYSSLQEVKLEKNEKVVALKSVDNNDTYGVRLPDYLTFAGEEIPIQNMDVRERLDRELLVNSYWHSSTILMHKRANRWLPIIEPILAENNIPSDFKYLAMAESGLQNVVSSAGATGFWQFLRGAGKEMGLTINSEIDERYHVEKATKAACKYLQKLYDKFGSWPLAAAAYNMGPTGLQKQLDRQEEDDYFNLILNDETSRYVFRILAIKTIHEAPHDFGFNLDVQDMYQPYNYRILQVDESVPSWPKFCKDNNITYRELKLLNPWLRDAKLTNESKKTYKVKVIEK